MEQKNDKPKFYLIIHGVQKSKNIGTLIRSAAAFNIAKVFLVHKTKHKDTTSKILKQFKVLFGSKGTAKKIGYEVFPKLACVVQKCKDENIFICGVEICEKSQSITKHPFKGDTAFFIGNEGSGLIDPFKKVCDHLVYIPQFTDKTASLNVAVAGSIIFHHFATWANYEESQMFGEKFRNTQLEQTQDKKFFDFKINKEQLYQININQQTIQIEQDIYIDITYINFYCIKIDINNLISFQYIFFNQNSLLIQYKK